MEESRPNGKGQGAEHIVSVISLNLHANLRGKKQLQFTHRKMNPPNYLLCFQVASSQLSTPPDEWLLFITLDFSSCKNIFGCKIALQSRIWERREEEGRGAEGRGNQRNDALVSSFCFKNSPSHIPPALVFGLPGMVNLILYV